MNAALKKLIESDRIFLLKNPKTCRKLHPIVVIISGVRLIEERTSQKPRKLVKEPAITLAANIIGQMKALQLVLAPMGRSQAEVRS